LFGLLNDATRWIFAGRSSAFIANLSGRAPPAGLLGGFSSSWPVARLPYEAFPGSGQKWFVFEEADDEIVVPYRDRRTVDDWFDEGLRLEDSCQYQEAAEAYKSALHLEPDDPVLHFNLGNVCASLKDPDKAIKHFVIAMQIDPEYEEAWTNLETVRAPKCSDGARPAHTRSRRHVSR